MSVHHYANKYEGSPAENYEKYFVPHIGAPLAKELVMKAKLRSGDKLLDVACGTGIVTRLAAREVGPSGRADGMDINPGMLQVANDVVPGAHYVHWYQGDMEDMPFEDNSYDVVMCQMSLQFVEDKHKALEEMHRVITPGGRLLLNLPGPESPMFKVMDKALEKNVNDDASNFLKKVFSLYDPVEISNMLTDAGFKNLAVEHEKKELHLPEAKEFLWQYIYSTPLSAMLANTDDDTCGELEKEVLKKWKKYEKNNVMHYEQEITFARATA